MLFNDKQLFDTGKKQIIHYDLPDAELTLREQFFDREEADKYYDIFLATTPWKQHTREMYGKMVADPRLTAWYGPEGHAFTPELMAIKQRVEFTCRMQFDNVLLNFYRDGQDSVSWHADGKPESRRYLSIASVSFGETRPFQLRHKNRKDIGMLEIPLTHGSFLMMGYPMQECWEHHIPKTSKAISPRINLTFRVLANGFYQQRGPGLR